MGPKLLMWLPPPPTPEEQIEGMRKALRAYTIKGPDGDIQPEDLHIEIQDGHPVVSITTNRTGVYIYKR